MKNNGTGGKGELLLSVLMTVYNREKYLAEAIESVLESDFTNFEFVIVDDHSTDKSYSIAQEYAGKDSRIRLYRNHVNIGDYPNRNKAASYARGIYIKYVDSDDAIFDWGLRYCVQQMELYPGAALGTLCFKKNITESCVVSEIIIREHFFKKALLNIGPSGTIFRRNAFEKLGLFDTSFGIASDTYMNIKLGSLYPVVLLPKEFFFYRKHDEQEQNDSYYKYMLNNYRYQEALFKEEILPIKNEELLQLKKKLKKDFAFTVLKSVVKPGKLKGTLSVSRKIHFGPLDFIKSLLSI